MVNHPPHYARFKFEPIDVLQDWFPTNPLLWQVGKYIARAEHKGNAIQDLEKARFYLNREIDRLKALSATETKIINAWNNNVSGTSCLICNTHIKLGQLAARHPSRDGYVHRECYLKEEQEH